MSGHSNDRVQPVIFLSHGGGPSFFMDVKEYPDMRGMDRDSEAAKFLQNLTRTHLNKRPEAILVVSAHWEENVPCVMDDPNHSLFFDYYGFPKSMYDLKWPAKGAPAVAARVTELFKTHGISCRQVRGRGLDHGVFVPLILVWPEADIPTFQVSLKNTLDIKEHQEIGEALSELRKDGILIVGSGFMTHSSEKAKTVDGAFEWANEFKVWERSVFCDPKLSASERKTQMLECESLRFFHKAHPRIEHFLPLVVASAASDYVCGEAIFSQFVSPSLLLEHVLFKSGP
ncbi:5-DOPA dioxygenase extradiol-like [Octopus vulgaris]|uniref:5-DOPA dioxygenase extradiol-like n=1 Tax=Octopus vulgaris TaxID=6645 RepID=A0AA36AIV4_OCTVU|nr:5-DOPA dioxygenase extradiol-like [Octopus vulgaris]